jgi:mannose-6-phosphate isomerase-like protein (cupin superfamily)
MDGKTIVTHAADASFERGLRSFFEYRHLGIPAATDGRMGAHVIRAVPGEHPKPEWHLHELDFQFVYILKGWVEFEYEDAGFVRLEAGSSVLQPPRVRHREVRHSDDIEILEITSPAEFVTKVVAAP